MSGDGDRELGIPALWLSSHMHVDIRSYTICGLSSLTESCICGDEDVMMWFPSHFPLPRHASAYKAICGLSSYRGFCISGEEDLDNEVLLSFRPPHIHTHNYIQGARLFSSTMSQSFDTREAVRRTI
jgi:hypothetical protein